MDKAHDTFEGCGGWVSLVYGCGPLNHNFLPLRVGIVFSFLSSAFDFRRLLLLLLLRRLILLQHGVGGEESAGCDPPASPAGLLGAPAGR